MDQEVKLYNHCMDKFFEMGVMRENSILCREKKILYEGVEYNTRYYEEYLNIRDFIILEETKLDKDILNKVEDLILKNNDFRLPTLKKNSTIKSWRNGVWFAELPLFMPYSLGNIPKGNDICASGYIDQVFDTTDYGIFNGMDVFSSAYNDRVLDTIQHGIPNDIPHVINQVVQEYVNLIEYPCPIIGILRNQGYGRKEQIFILGMFGRLLFPLGRYDKWEFVPFLWGPQENYASIIDAIESLYNHNDIGHIRSIDGGVSDVVGKMLWVERQVKSNFPIEVSDIQTITSGELMSFDQTSFKWDISCILAGSVIPKLWDNSFNALKRRVLFIPLATPGVSNELVYNIGSFCYMITMAYHYLQKQIGDKNLLDFLPEKLKLFMYDS
jgi:hypothetical protein